MPSLTPPVMHLPNDDDLEKDLEGDVDDDLSLGGGPADTDALIYCPYCGEEVQIAVDPGGGTSQEYVEDCQVCCQPWRVIVHYDSDGHADVSVIGLEE